MNAALEAFGISFLSEMFGYATQLRSMTQGRGTFTMTPSEYAAVPANLEKEIAAARGVK